MIATQRLNLTNKCFGLTLIELIITLSLIGLLSAMSMPAFIHSYQSTVSESHIQEILQHINQARYHAIITQTPTTICHSKSGSNCDGQWTDGFIGFSDQNRNYHLDQDDELLFIFNRRPNLDKLTWKSFLSKKNIQFDPNGYCYTHNGTLTYHASNSKKLIYKIIINRQGRIRLEKPK